jgi:hypothetical protein
VLIVLENTITIAIAALLFIGAGQKSKNIREKQKEIEDTIPDLQSLSFSLLL